MACEVNNKEINSQCAELLVRPTYMKVNFTDVLKLHNLILYNPQVSATVWVKVWITVWIRV